jgi:hypothetical protein
MNPISMAGALYSMEKLSEQNQPVLDRATHLRRQAQQHIANAKRMKAGPDKLKLHETATKLMAKATDVGKKGMGFAKRKSTFFKEGSLEYLMWIMSR